MNIFKKFKKESGNLSNLETLNSESDLTLEIDTFTFIDLPTNDRICELMSKITHSIFISNLKKVEAHIEFKEEEYFIELESQLSSLIVRLSNPSSKKITQAFFGIEYIPFDEYGPSSGINDFTLALNPNSQFEITPGVVMKLLELIDLEITKRFPSELPLVSNGKDQKPRIQVKPKPTSLHKEEYHRKYPLTSPPRIHIPTDEEMGIPLHVSGETNFQRILRITDARKEWQQKKEQ